MADVTGPISSLPGARHAVPDNTVCDNCAKALATIRIQGETDSFGCEMIDLCAACYAAEKEAEATAEKIPWSCDWCKTTVDNVVPARDYDEGMHGPVYYICKECNDEKKERELREYDFFASDDADDFDYYDDYDDDED